MNPLEKRSYIFSLVCYSSNLKTAGKKFNKEGEQLSILSHSRSVAHSSHAFRAHINLVHFKQQITKKKKKLSIINYISSQQFFIDSTQITPSVTESKYLWDEMRQLFHGAQQRRGSEEYQHIKLQLQGEFR